METIVFEPMSVGRIFDRAFLIYRNNFLRFVTIVALIEVPLLLLSTASRAWTDTRTPTRSAVTNEPTKSGPEDRSRAARQDPVELAPLLFNCFGSSLGLLLQIVGSMLCQAALIKSVSETYLGHEIGVGEAYRFILPKSLTLFAATLCTTLVMGLGLALCIVPGIIFGLWFAVTTPAIIVEGYAATSGMARSKALVANNLGKVFTVGLLATLIFYLTYIPLYYLSGLLAGALFPNNVMLASFLKHFAGTLSAIVVTPVSASASILLYYDLRIRKEGFDLQMLAQSMASEQGELRAS